MLRQHPLLVFISMLFLATLACNAFAGEAEPDLSVPPPIVTLEDGTAVADEDSSDPNIAPTATLPGDSDSGDGTAVASGNPIVTILVDLNIRSGPGVIYDRLGFFLEGSTAQVLGQDPTSGWWLVACPAEINAPQCWVSGGSQYTLGSNTGSVPVAAVPPTPTPEPTTVPTTEPDANKDEIAGYIAHNDSDGLWLLPLDTSQSPPAAGEPIQVAGGSDISHFAISPNGQQIAFVAGDFDGNRLGVVSTSGDGQILVESDTLTNTAGDGFAVVINQIDWLPDNETIAFNSQIVNLEGPGVGPQADLWLVTTDGMLTEQFAAGTAGHSFALSPDGTRLIMGNPEGVTRVNLDGSNAEEVITFPFVNTASEYAWVPTAQWLPGGSQAYVAIAAADPWQADAEATLYQIPVSGPAVEIGTILGNTLFSPPNWNQNGSRLGYVQLIVNSDNTQYLVLADGDGDDPVPYDSADQLTAAGWNSPGTHFLYAGLDFLGIAEPDESTVEILLGGTVGNLLWLDDDAFVTAVGSSNNWELLTGNLAGNTRTVGETAVSFPEFDVWLP